MNCNIHGDMFVLHHLAFKESWVAFVNPSKTRLRKHSQYPRESIWVCQLADSLQASLQIGISKDEQIESWVAFTPHINSHTEWEIKRRYELKTKMICPVLEEFLTFRNSNVDTPPATRNEQRCTTRTRKTSILTSQPSSLLEFQKNLTNLIKVRGNF